MQDLITFKSLDDLTSYFVTDKKCVEYFEQARWNGERACPHCGGLRTYTLKGVGKYKCGEKGCRLLFSITTGTYFENTKLPLRKWLIAMYLCLNHKKGVSSLQLAETLGITQKSAWFVLHRLRAILHEQRPDMLLGEDKMVEVDETFIGGKEVNKHRSKKDKQAPQDRHGHNGKKVVVGAMERGGKVRALAIDNASKKSLEPFVHGNVKEGARVITDEWSGYRGLKQRYTHDTIQHGAKEYVVGDIHTNTIENFWSVVKRCLYGTYHQVSRKHLQAYLNEFTFRFSTRHNSGEQRFRGALANCHGRLKYSTLIENKKGI